MSGVRGAVRDGRARGRDPTAVPKEPRPYLSDVARLRQVSYALLGAWLQYPEAATVAASCEAARFLRPQDRWASQLAFYHPWQDFVRQIERPIAGGLQKIQGSYSALFGASVVLAPIPLCESGFADATGVTPEWVIASLARQYVAAGVQVSARGEALDHAAVELEFVSWLCSREAEAWEAGSPAGALSTIEQQVSILEQHLCRWMPPFSEAVAARDRLGFFTALARAGHALVSHDADFLRALVAHQQGEEIDARRDTHRSRSERPRPGHARAPLPGG